MLSSFTDLEKRQKESGLSIRSFCTNEGIPTSTFYYWKKKIREEEAGQRFIPLLVRTPGSGTCPAGQRDDTMRDDTSVEIIYRNGTILRINQTLDLAGLRSLVSLLD
jgi:hypothetical protein